MLLPESADPAVTELLDREAIRDCLTRYSHGVDRCDIEALKSAFWPDAVDSHGPFFKGNAWELAEFAIPIQRRRDQRMHSLSNMLIRVEGRLARAQTYVFAYTRVRPQSGKPPYDVLMGGRYLDLLEKRGREWRIAERHTITDWFRQFDDSADWEKGLFGKPQKMGTIVPDDAVAAFFGDRIR